MFPMWSLCRSLPGRPAPRCHDDVAQGALAPLRMEGIVAVADHRKQNKGESGYSLLFSAGGRWYIRIVFPLLGIVLGGAFYVWYTLRRRARSKRAVGRLNSSLNLHICFGILGLAFLLMHSFGNFNPRSGTYALYSMIALVVSGVVGRILDRLVPRLIAGHRRTQLSAFTRLRTCSWRQTSQSPYLAGTLVRPKLA